MNKWIVNRIVEILCKNNRPEIRAQSKMNLVCCGRKSWNSICTTPIFCLMETLQSTFPIFKLFLVDGFYNLLKSIRKRKKYFSFVVFMISCKHCYKFLSYIDKTKHKYYNYFIYLPSNSLLSTSVINMECIDLFLILLQPIYINCRLQRQSAE